MKVWAFIDWYEADNLRLFKNKRDVYNYVSKFHYDLMGKKVKITDKNLEKISKDIGFSIKQMKVE